eukprot:TRINITY_DN6233_c0_g1_i5.p1 TRINITY_DN6233_c0_g1~~TRINITY_DN6233_c0_g1_i5.p1  ORF type:complete len:137 (-),score=35.21 TRINITY_DN6233_c0_g1_i5:57-467(-)
MHAPQMIVYILLTSIGSVLDARGNILIVPQATLAATIKGKYLQYRTLVEKEKGLELYNHFIHLVRQTVSARVERDAKQASSSSSSSSSSSPSPSPSSPSPSSGSDDIVPVVQHGVYGNRQGMRIVSNGPHSHMFEY